MVKPNVTPTQTIKELIAKISLLEEELEISREQVKTIKEELSLKTQELKYYKEELQLCKQEMAILNIELQNIYKSIELRAKA